MLIHHPSDAVLPSEPWPDLPYAQWQPTKDTLHMWTQIVGKIKLALAPRENHAWQSALYVTTRGLTTGPMPLGPRTFTITFDFISQRLFIDVDDGRIRELLLTPRSVADFYGELFAVLSGLDLDVSVWPQPVEVPVGIRFTDDQVHASYDPHYAHAHWRVLLASARVLKQFRAEFLGKSSPVHFFWGSFDLAYSRFSGRRAPPRPGADSITREAYTHEVMSCGFWAGGAGMEQPIFYAYISPEPNGFRNAKVSVPGAYYDANLSEFLLPYDMVRTSADPDATLLAFCREVYAHAATLANWDRAALESRPPDAPASETYGT